MEDDQFTLDEANSLIPWLEEIFQRLTPGRQEYLALRTRLEESGQDSGGSSSSSSSDDLAQSREEMDRLGRELQDGIEEILDRGIIFRDFEQGLVDFTATAAVYRSDSFEEEITPEEIERLRSLGYAD